MEDVKRILVLSRSTKYCRLAVHYGISLAKQYGASLYVLHVIHDPFRMDGWALPIPSLKTLEEEYKNMQKTAKKDLEQMVWEEGKSIPIQVMIREGDPKEEILNVVEKEKIDLLIMLAHEEGRVEHFLFCQGMEELVRKMPCSIMLVKKELEPAAQ